MTNNPQQMDLMPEAQPISSPVECLGQTFESDVARREYYLKRLRTALEELHAKLSGVTWTTLEDAVTHLNGLQYWQMGDADRLRELAERMRESARGNGHGKDLLQLWKDEVGFPHGEIEDILRLSDPPYYTACPNPFIGEFIAYYGKPYDPSTNDYRREPFAADVSEGRNDPIFAAHSYHTKVPHKAIVNYILHYTNPGDIVLDGFSGSGMTGVASQWCGTAPNSYKQELELAWQNGGFGIPKWGLRRAILSDLAPAATFISSNYNIPFNQTVFALDAKKLLDDAQTEIGWMYEVTHSPSSKIGRIEYTVWSEVFSCPNCTTPIVFVDEALDEETGEVEGDFPCPHCGTQLSKRTLDRVFVTQDDPILGNNWKHINFQPSFITYIADGIKIERKLTQDDFSLISRIGKLPFPSEVPSVRFPIEKMYHGSRIAPKGFTHIHHFYFPRAAQTLAYLWRKANAKQNVRLRNMLLFFVEQTVSGLSVLNRYAPSHWSQSNKALNGVYYIPSQVAEVSPWYPLAGKLKRLIKAFEKPYATTAGAIVATGSTTHLNIPDDTVDYIFTDPPFGENIYYADLNFLVESWHRVWTSTNTEAIVDTHKEKNLHSYQRLMQDCFAEYYRVLKPGRWMTVVFHNSRNSVWNAIQEALQAAGFVVADVRTLDKQRGSFRQVTSIAVKQDLIISAYKPNGGLEERFRIEAGTENGVWDFVRTHLKQLPIFVVKEEQVEVIAERQNYLLFDRMVAFHVQHGVMVPMSASEFYTGLEQRFSERDGMYFLSEQVAEYDKKRMTAKEVMQLTLFVTDEASAIQWLKQQLTKKPQTFQDLHPQFMKQIAGWSKYEKSLELRDLLEENFLIYDGLGEVNNQIHSYLSTNYKDMRNLAKDDPRLREEAKDRWYVPDPNKTGDLEKLRERSLLHEFAEYRDSKARKLKVFRLEAVRAGFKKAWGERDYATILAVAEKIPDAVLQEDAKLLMWYDQALTRSGK